MKKIFAALSLIALMGAGCSNAPTNSASTIELKTVSPTETNSAPEQNVQVNTSLQIKE